MWIPIARYVHELMGHPARVLDPAAGRGEFIGSIEADERWAVDMVAHDGSQAFEGVNVIVSEIMAADLPEGHFDGVFVSNFLEHLDSQDEVYEFLVKMRTATATAGRIALLGPNIAYCAREYWDFADHKVPLTHNAAAEHLYMAGFEPERIIPRFIPYSFRSRLPATGGLAAAYLAFPPAWRLLGKQFLLIGRKVTEPATRTRSGAPLSGGARMPD